jgi:Flp pilus assembly protein TadG
MRIPRTITWLALWRDTVGAAMVEFTLVAPFLLFLGLGMSEFGRFFYQYQLVLDGLRDGARYLARTQDPTSTANKDRAKCLALTGTISNSGGSCTGTARVEGWGAVTFNVAPINNSAGTYRGGATIYTVQASTTFSYLDVGFLDTLGLPAISIVATHMQRAIGE